MLPSQKESNAIKKKKIRKGLLKVYVSRYGRPCSPQRKGSLAQFGLHVRRLACTRWLAVNSYMFRADMYIYMPLYILWRPKPLKRCVRSVVRLRYIHHLISEKPWKNYENTYFFWGGQTLSLVTGCGFNKIFLKNMSFFDFCLHYAPQRPIEELTWRYNSTEKSGDSHSSLKCKIYSFGLHCWWRSFPLNLLRFQLFVNLDFIRIFF